MMQRSIAGLLTVLSTSVVAAQPPDLDMSRAVAVTPVAEVSPLEHAVIFIRHALVPGIEVVALLHAYKSDVVCDPASGDLAALLGHDGSAALVVAPANPSTAYAFYHGTVDGAISEAQASWCNAVSNGQTWQFATSSPVSTIKEATRYLTRDVERIQSKVREGQGR